MSLNDVALNFSSIARQMGHVSCDDGKKKPRECFLGDLGGFRLIISRLMGKKSLGKGLLEEGSKSLWYSRIMGVG